MKHSPGFLKLVNETRLKVTEISLAQARERLAKNPKAVLVDVREDAEWVQGHARGAVHLGKGILERDIEQAVPDLDTELIMYCGGGVPIGTDSGCGATNGIPSRGFVTGRLQGARRGGMGNGGARRMNSRDSTDKKQGRLGVPALAGWAPIAWRPGTFSSSGFSLRTPSTFNRFPAEAETAHTP
jgi:hypothetical protein